MCLVSLAFPQPGQMVVIALMSGESIQQSFVDILRLFDLAEKDAAGSEVSLEDIDPRLQLIRFPVKGPGSIGHSNIRIYRARPIQVERAVTQSPLVFGKQSGSFAVAARNRMLIR